MRSNRLRSPLVSGTCAPRSQVNVYAGFFHQFLGKFLITIHHQQDGPAAIGSYWRLGYLSGRLTFQLPAKGRGQF